MKKDIKKDTPPQTVVEKILELFKAYQDTTGAILDDYVADKDMIMELSQADRNFIEEIKDLETDDDFESLVKKLSELDSDEIDADKILSLLDESDIIDWTSNEGYVTVEVEGAEDRDKLEEFIRKEIYPYSLNSLKPIF